MTPTAVQTGLSLSTAGDGINATKTTLGANTVAASLHIKFTPGIGNRNTACGKLKVFMAISPFSVTTADAPKFFKGSFNTVIEVLPGQDVQAVCKRSRLVTADGTYAYVWTDVPTYNNAPSLDATIMEVD
jgi:hypothetical protein